MAFSHGVSVGNVFENLNFSYQYGPSINYKLFAFKRKNGIAIGPSIDYVHFFII